jgi:hypothetical protein
MPKANNIPATSKISGDIFTKYAVVLSAISVAISENPISMSILGTYFVEYTCRCKSKYKSKNAVIYRLSTNGQYKCCNNAVDHHIILRNSENTDNKRKQTMNGSIKESSGTVTNSISVISRNFYL